MAEQTIAQALREITDGLADCAYAGAARLYAIVARLETGACGHDPMPSVQDEPPAPGEPGPGTGGGGGKLP